MMTNDPARSQSRAALPFMLLSAAIFGYFGFTTSWNYTGMSGEFLLFVAMLDWTLKMSAIVFGLSALMTLVQPVWGNLIYAVTGLASAVMFAVVAVLDIMDTQHTAFSPLMLFLFAAWNGIGSWTSLRETLAHRRVSSPQ